MIGARRGALELRFRPRQIVEPEQQVAVQVSELFRRHAGEPRLAGGPPPFRVRENLQRPGALAKIGVHLAQLQAVQDVARKALRHGGKQRDRFLRMALAAIDPGKQHLRVKAVADAFFGHQFERPDAARAVTGETGEEAEDAIAERQAADDVVVQPFYEAGVEEGGIRQERPPVQFPGLRGVAERAEPFAAHQEVVVRAQAVADAERVQRLRIPGLRPELRRGERHRPANSLFEIPLDFGRRMHVRPPQKGVRPRHQFAFERAGAVHLAVQDRLRDMVPGRGRRGILLRCPAKHTQRGREVQVIERHPAGVLERVLRRQQRRGQ